MLECRYCRTKGDRTSCPGKPWYSFNDIKFCRQQVVWLLEWLPALRGGLWPLDMKTTGYTETPRVQKSRSRHAYFENPCQIAAEIDYRLSQCGLDRYLVEDLYINGFREEDIAQKLGLEVEEVYRRINAILNYISGWVRKDCSFREWRGHRRKLSNAPNLGQLP